MSAGEPGIKEIIVHVDTFAEQSKPTLQMANLVAHDLSIHSTNIY